MDLDDTQVAGEREHATPMVSIYWKSELPLHVDAQAVCTDSCGYKIEVCPVTEARCATISHHWQYMEI